METLELTTAGNLTAEDTAILMAAQERSAQAKADRAASQSNYYANRARNAKSPAQMRALIQEMKYNRTGNSRYASNSF